jgi:hypothetical protein
VQSLSKLPADPIVAVVAHRAVKVPARILPDALKPTSINAPQFYSRHAATTLTWLPRGQGEVSWPLVCAVSDGPMDARGTREGLGFPLSLALAACL